VIPTCFQRIHGDSMEWVRNPPASSSGEWLETIDSEESLVLLGGFSRNPIRYKSSKNQIATNLLRENVKDPVRLNESS
jgi:hypothetical protein